MLSILPALKWKCDQEKSPVNLVIAEQYAYIVSNLDYIMPHIWNGHWQDLEGALKMAKQHYSKVTVPQTYGKTVAIQHRYPSFQYDQWQRAGVLHLWDKLPLIIPRPTNAKELVERHMGNRPAILFADKSESSQFEKSDELAGLLQQQFGQTHQVIRLSTIRLERFTDFVALYDAADAIIVTETAHLHLSKATAKPVFALVTDKPQRWHGSAWSKHFKAHIRYSAYERRKAELIESIRSVL